MCFPPALKIITNNDHLMDRGKSIDGVKKPKRVSFDLEAKQTQAQVQVQAVQIQEVKTPLAQNNDLIFSQMFVFSQLKNNLEIAFLRIASLEKDLKESKSREEALMVFYEKYNNKHKPLPRYYYYNLDVTQTIV